MSSRCCFVRRLFLLLLFLSSATAAVPALRISLPSIRREQPQSGALARPAGRSLLYFHELVEPNTELVVDRDGKVSLMHQSGKAIWSFASGSPIIQSLYEAPMNAENIGEKAPEIGSTLLSESLDESEAKMVDAGYVRKKMQDLVEQMPLVTDDGVTSGSTRSTTFLIDGRSGRLIHVFKSHETNSTLTPTVSEHIAELSLYVTRRDSNIVHFNKTTRKLLWNVTVSDFRANLDCEPTFISVDELGPEILPGIYMPLRCGSQIDVRPLIKSEFFIRFPSDLPANMLSGEELDGDKKAKNLAAPAANHKFRSHSRTYRHLSSIQDSKSKASISLSSSRTKNSERVHYSGTLDKLFKWPPYYFLAVVLLVTAVYCSVPYVYSLVSRRQFFPKVIDDSYTKAAPSKKKKTRKSGKDGVINEKKDELLAPGYQERFECMEGGNQRLLSVNNPQSVAADGRKIGKLFLSSKEIAKGSNGTVVFEGIYEGRPVAVKRLVRSHHEVAFKEIQNLIASDQHPNIVRWHGVEHDRDFVYLSLERCACSLDDLIQTYSDLPKMETFGNSRATKAVAGYKIRLDSLDGVVQGHELWKPSGHPTPLMLKIMRDIVSGLAHLHELGIVHRDLKPQNVLVSKGKTLSAKLSDMGISKRLPGDMSSLGHLATGCGSSGWQAPEQLLLTRQTRAVDMFSLGCVLFFGITGGKHPFGDNLERDVNIVKNKVDLFLVEHVPEASDLISRLLNPNPELRPNANAVLLHPIFWSSEMRLSFLRDSSDRVELENREVDSDILKALENTASVAIGGKWDEKLEAIFITNIGHYRRYKYNSVRDLLRVIRNKLNHYRELPQEIQELVGTVPEGFDEYFAVRFPKLLIEVYRVIYEYCKEEEIFRKYFKYNIV